MSLTITSPAFRDGEVIPIRHTRDGENLSPPLAWRDAPPETRSYVLIVEDPDAPSGTFRHWVLYNIPAGETGLPEGTSAQVLRGAGECVNGFGKTRYDGPQPPKGHGPHHYHFRLAALDAPRLDIPASTRAEDVWAKVQPHIIAEAEVVGVYER
ncbi:YbhB/YbcL family Raf kinase inhibitor-like protein [Microvirga lotononidis]|uniref:Raf kinase inhibitor-like protein, YbhB/YbcL family n=1 Tax=Microvirga lotononidis TaxID=864069 RepID=I4Z3T9_9HYPH|nr:YbhB/YbcL family Raf kinase inhibitor-like protein [Microvirga lotononidis]EIM30159.1 Raf kinase inhibitor-like protein, YbhB/YbcL family [Microvirga lotononidis]EIM30881.1 Raf kinase inhibitor-like protein, YbhB/YbcL family [Microvirga lotononidis]WQO31809.1 YbhB/YbcL family Raf kinase inhibitor-like protein [Microvirga lotononidis]